MCGQSLCKLWLLKGNRAAASRFFHRIYHTFQKYRKGKERGRNYGKGTKRLGLVGYLQYYWCVLQHLKRLSHKIRFAWKLYGWIGIGWDMWHVIFIDPLKFLSDPPWMFKNSLLYVLNRYQCWHGSSPICPPLLLTNENLYNCTRDQPDILNVFLRPV